MTFLNRHRSRIRPVGPFAPSSLFFGGIPGAWYDPTDLSTMFQDSTGTTPVTAVEQPVGLILDKSQGLAQGSQLVVNGDGTTLAGWTTADDAGCSSTVSGGQFVLSTVAGGAARLRQTIPTTAGKTYAISIFCNTSASNATAAFTVWGAAYGITTLFSANAVANGVITAIVQATSANIYLQLSAFSVSTGLTNFYDDVSVRELAGNHASQSTAASRPTYRARYNLLVQSEDFGSASWVSNAAPTVTTNVAVAPDGTLTADQFSTTSANSGKYQVASVVSGATHVFSISVKYVSGDTSVRVGNDANPSTGSVVVNTQTGAIVSQGASVISASVVDQGNGWFRVSVRYASTNALVAVAVYSQNAVATSWLAWGAQLLTAADVTATGNAYQRIAAATVYDTAAVFRPYLAFDGLDDSLSTAAINFTSTDKMTVFAGVTKLGSSFGVISELGNNGFFNAGNFYLGTGSGTGIPATPVDATAMNGNAAYAADYDSAAPPVGRVYSQLMDMSQPTGATEMRLRINAAFATINGTIGTSAGTGTFANAALNIGHRAGGSFRMNGRLFSLIVRGAASSVTEIADTELWVNARTGAF